MWTVLREFFCSLTNFYLMFLKKHFPRPPHSTRSVFWIFEFYENLQKSTENIYETAFFDPKAGRRLRRSRLVRLRVMSPMEIHVNTDELGLSLVIVSHPFCWRVLFRFNEFSIEL